MISLPLLPASAEWSVQVRDVASGRVLAEREPDRVLKTASVGKVFLLAEAARQMVAGDLDPAERLAWRDDELVADSGLWQLLSQRELALGDLCVLIGSVSDNLATNVLLRRVGLPAVTALTASLGVRDSALLDRVRDERTPDLPPTLSLGTAAEWCELMGRLARRELVSPEVSDLISGWLAANVDLGMVALPFQLDGLAHREPDRGFRLVNKTGAISTARADTGYVESQQGLICWFAGANWATGTDPRDEVMAALAAIGTAIRRRLA